MTVKILAALAALVVGLVLAAVVAGLIGSRRWQRATARLDAAVTAPRDPSPPLASDALPAPVARYLARAVPDGAPAIRVARLRQEGVFHMAGQGWKDFSAVEVFRVDDPAFYWDADIAMMPLVPVRVLDSYAAAGAGMQARVGGLVPVMDATGAAGGGLAEGALARYLAEAVWFPTRLAVGPELTWTAVDDRSADATLEHRGTRVTLRFTFDTNGDPIRVEGMRPMEVDGAYLDAPWIGRFADHREADGYRIPLAGEVAWIVEGREEPYWRGRIVEAEFDVH